MEIRPARVRSKVLTFMLRICICDMGAKYPGPENYKSTRGRLFPRDVAALGGKLLRYVGLLGPSDRAHDRAHMPVNLSSDTRVVFADRWLYSR
jgi:hypothetical protein